MPIPLTLPVLKNRIAALPRAKLAFLPTPLHEVPRFAEALGGPRIFLKRDDQTGLAFGGNKTRMFDFLLAEIAAEGVDTVIGGAAVQSNYCRQLTAACNAFGLEVHLVLRRIRGEKDNDIQGNLFLDLIAGAHVHVIDATLDEQNQALYALSDRLTAQGKKPRVVRMANDEDLAPDVIAYVECFCEIVEQSQALSIEPTHIYVSSCDTTQAGLELGKRALGSTIDIVGITPADFEPDIPRLITTYLDHASARLALPIKGDPEDVLNSRAYIGEGYGKPTSEGIAMIKLMAKTEGIFLDPVYTSKACAALADDVRQGRLTSDDTVVFIHTGGTPALFAYRDDLDVPELKTRLFLE
jgi:1-aminocyclopropane-1-carboxylate deaminase/D-cysteine desulfhydrase-like pyridoxal-dependent ACC family enzyme